MHGTPSSTPFASHGVLWLLLLVLTGCGTSDPSGQASENEPTYVGRAACAECHQQETRNWRGSHHDLAMQHAADSTVRAVFDSSLVNPGGERARFYREDSVHYVRTEGPDGRVDAFEIAYTFGVEPLQQYLVETDGGRLQALNLAWDVEENEWFDLYPDDTLRAGDPQHWTGRLHTWNTMCASCHSTNLRKNYDPESDTYETQYSEVDVSCESCHGPGSRHVEWARGGASRSSPGGGEAEDAGANYSDGSESDVGPSTDGATSTGAPRSTGGSDHTDGAYGLTVDLDTARAELEIQTCARCHSRRQKLSTEFRPGDGFLDHYAPRLLDEGLYHPDGQIDDEVYVYGSFLQSKMYRRDVQCTDCHEPHSLELRLEGNALCTQCHSSPKFDTREHHFHPPETAGARCVSCHMPGKTYMQIDFRRDHSIRIPRPDLSAELGTPNACTRCHTDRSEDWAAEAAQRWWGTIGTDSVHYGEVFAPARAHEPSAVEPLVQTASDSARSPIVRATALSLLGRYVTGDRAREDAVRTTLRSGLEDPSPLMRRAAVGALRSVPPYRRSALVGPLLTDTMRSVRIEAARVLASAPESAFSAERLDEFEAAFSEYERAMGVTAERPESHMNLAAAYRDRGNIERARREFRTALRLDSTFVPALLEWGRMENQQNRNDRAEELLRRAVNLRPDLGEAHYMLGLLLGETRTRLEEAATHLERAAELLPERPRVQYNYGLAMQRLGRREAAEEALRSAHELSPRTGDFLYALAVLSAQQEDWEAALRWMRELQKVEPSSRRADQLLNQIRSRAEMGG